MALAEKTKGKLAETSADIKVKVEELRKDVAKLTDKFREKLKRSGDETKEAAEELTKEVKSLTQRVKDIMPGKKKGSAKVPVSVEPQRIYSSEIYEPLMEMKRSMRRMLDDYFGEEGLIKKRWEEPWEIGTDLFGRKWPRLDVSETEKEIVLTAELPGVEKSDIEVTVSDNMVTIKGEKKKEEEKKGKNYYRMERSYGSFRRSVALPCEVDRSKVDASFKKGVLTVTLPKSVEAMKKVKKISVK